MAAKREQGRVFYDLDLEAPLLLSQYLLGHCRPALIQCGRGLHKGVATRRQGTSRAILEVGNNTAL